MCGDSEMQKLAENVDGVTDPVRIAIVGKYTHLCDSYISVSKVISSIQNKIQSVRHAAYAINKHPIIDWVEATDLEDETKEKNPEAYQKAWDRLYAADGILVPGGFGNRGVEGMIKAASFARVEKKPYLGICLGLQVAVISYARSIFKKRIMCRDVCEMEDANSEEFAKTSHPVIVSMPEHNVEQKGGTMRLGERMSLFKDSAMGFSMMYKLYGKQKGMSSVCV